MIQDGDLQPNDAVGLAFANYQYKHNIKPTISHNISPTITTKGEVVVIERG